MAGKRFHIHDVVAHRAGEGQKQAGLLIVELRPEDARRIKEQNALGNRDPLL